MIEYKDKVKYSKNNEIGVVLGFMRGNDKYLVKFSNDNEEWIYGRCLIKIDKDDES